MNTHIKTVFTALTLAGVFFLISCSPGGSAVQLSDANSTTCNLTASLTMASSNVSAGVPVIFQVSATGCTGNYILVHDGFLDQSFSSLGTSYSKVFSNISTGVFEQVLIKSVDSRGVVMGSAYATSALFNVVNGPSSLSCTASAQNPTGSVIQDTKGNLASPALFQFTVLPSQSAQVTTVSVGGVNQTLPGVPTSSSNNIVISNVPVSTTGAVNINFTVQANTQTAYCNTIVNVGATTATAPVITALTSNSPIASYGNMVTYTIQTTNATSATIDGKTVTLDASGNGFSTSPTSSTGVLNIIATASGPGGQATRSLNQTVNPSCTLTALASSAAVNSTYPFSVTIQGAFQSAVISSSALTSFSIAGSSSSVSQTVNVPVSSAKSSATATLTVTGPGGTSAQCSANIKTTSSTTTSSDTSSGCGSFAGNYSGTCTSTAGQNGITFTVSDSGSKCVATNFNGSGPYGYLYTYIGTSTLSVSSTKATGNLTSTNPSSLSISSTTLTINSNGSFKISGYNGTASLNFTCQ